jgi:rRNA maturation endonuclease Nob1
VIPDMAGLYIIDANSLIDLWVDRYPKDLFPSVWSKFEILVKARSLVTPEEVLRELSKKDDGLHEWVKAQEGMVVPIDIVQQEHLRRVMAKHGKLIDTRRNRSQGDPFVVALALAAKATVVTEEQATGSLDRPKIPDVCRAMGVPCMSLRDLFREMGWRF